MIGYPGSMLIKKMKMKDPNIEMLEEKYYNEHLNEVKFFPDVENTFKELRKRDIKIGIVTSSRREMINKINLNVDAIVTMDDIKNGKPDIEPYMKATDIMKIKPENTMVVGDIDNDLIPSKILNCVSILVTHGIKKESEHKDYEIKEIHEILKIIDEKNL